MPKYTITIADTELCINTEETPEMVETLVKTVDQRVRGLLTICPRLSKSEAAILCAVDYCAETLKNDEKNRSLSDEIARLSEELNKVNAVNAELSTELDEARRENRIINDLISKNLSPVAAPAVTAGEQLTIEEQAEDTATEIASEPVVAEELSAPETVPASEVMFDCEQTEADGDTEEAPAEAAPKKSRRVTRRNGSTGKNKVGDMFDMLTFKDV